MANHRDNQGLDNNLLSWSAARAARWPHLFSSLIERYIEINNLSEAALCSLLRCDSATLNHLRLCGRPDPDPSEFAIDIQRVADKLVLDAGTLASIVREVDAAEAFSQARRNPSMRTRQRQVVSPFSSTPGMLKAARDRDEETRVEDQGADAGQGGDDGEESEVQGSEHQEGDGKSN